MLGISTCWWHHRVDRGDEIIDDVLDLGLKAVELEYRISESIYHQMKPKLGEEARVLSIHNYFPKPRDRAGSGDLFSLSSTEPDERGRAVKSSIRTIEYAHDLGAKAVVLHLGRVDMPNGSPRLSELKGHSVIDELMETRKARRQKNLDAVLSSLENLNREAEKKGVQLGIENRYYFLEIPDFEEIGIILKEFQGGNLGYWHDIGHARVQENMRIIRQKDLLEAYSQRLIGIHIHDVRGHDDHYAPGQGEMNFREIQPFLKSSHIKILEVHAKVDRNDLVEGIRYMKSIGMD